jgi:probable rRNA maturation factor
MPVEIQRLVQLQGIPPDEDLRAFAEGAVEDASDAAICIRIVDEAEGRALNRQWRGKDYATNVLAFPVAALPGLPDVGVPSLMGDIVVCAPVAAREASDQRKTLRHHWAHLVVHGVLHLRGFDHIQSNEAARMERLERELLTRLGVPDPYADGEAVDGAA